MKKQLFLFILIISSAFANAQAPSLLWAKNMGGVQNFGEAIAVSPEGNVYTTGSFQATSDFDPNAGTYNLTSSSRDIFISKLGGLGNFVWAKNIGGVLGENVGWSIALDKSENVYTTGRFKGTVDFDPNAGVFNLASVDGNADIFISKLDVSGNFVWAKSMGSLGSNDDGLSITVDASGNVYTVGVFNGTGDFDPNAGVFNLTSFGGTDIFISKLDASGNFVWAKQIGGSGYDRNCSVALDAIGNVYTVGTFRNTVDFDPNAGVYNLTTANAQDLFVSKLDSMGNFVWAKQIANVADHKISLALDSLGNVYTAGKFQGTVDFDPNVGVFNLTPAGTDLFICKLNALGSFVWAKNMGGALINTKAFSIALDKSGGVYTTGYFNGTSDFDPNAGVYNLTAANSDIFISKLDSSGNFAWAVSMFSGLQSQNLGASIALDASANIYTTGYLSDTTDFDPNAGVFNLYPIGQTDVFIHKMSQALFGITENKSSTNSLIYPNPSNGLYTIELAAKAEVTICNILGGVILNQVLQAGKQPINLQQQANGIYFVRLVSEGKQEGFKLVKEE